MWKCNLFIEKDPQKPGIVEYFTQASKVYILEFFPIFLDFHVFRVLFEEKLGLVKKECFHTAFLLQKIVFKCKNKRSYNEPDYFPTCFKSIVFNFGIKTLSVSFDGLMLKYLLNWLVWKKQVILDFLVEAVVILLEN